MKKNTTQLIVIIALICCTLTLLGVGIWLGVTDGNKGNKPTTPINSVEDDEDWTNNY